MGNTDHPSKKPKTPHPPPSASSNSPYAEISTFDPVRTNTPETSPATLMEDTEVDLFPEGTSHAAPQTPPRNDHLNAAAPGELSPPRSQGNASADAVTGALNGNGPVSAGGANGAQEPGNMSSFTDSGNAGLSFAQQGYGGEYNGTNKNEKGPQPGEWKTKKAQDEMVRAWEFVVDREWSAQEYGDVIMAGRQQGTGGS